MTATNTLRAFLWMRWRVLMNSLERSGARDRLERFSVAIEQLGPIMAAVLMIPSAILLAAAGGYGGWALARGNPRPLPFEALRFLLLAASMLSVVGPILLPAAERANAVRLLLLPISRLMLYVAQASTSLTDPWILLVVPTVAAVPIGMLLGGAWGGALVAAAAGVLLLLVLVGVTSLVSNIIHLILKDRRRGELLTLVFIMILPMLGMLPVLLEEGRSGAEGPGGHREDARWFVAVEQRAFPMVPSEMYVRATRTVADGDTTPFKTLAGLAAAAAGLHLAALFLFGRMLASPGSTGTRRSGSSKRARMWTIPGISPGASAVALAQIRLAFRTPRGRSILLSPFLLFAMFGALMWRSGSGADFGFISLQNGLALAVFASFMSLLAILPIAMNQFAIDGAGLTLVFLSPLPDKEVLLGKAIGNGVIAGMPALVCIGGAAALFPTGQLEEWIALPFGIAAAYALVAPVAATLSAVFPRAVDLNSIGRGSNAHGAAGFLGLGAIAFAGALTLLVGLLGTRVLDSPSLVPVLMLAWCAICGLLSRALFVPARAVLARRRENLALIR